VSRSAATLAGEGNCEHAVDPTVAELGGLDALVNNVATQQLAGDLTGLSTERWKRTFKVNVFSYFWTTRAALKHLPDGGIINTSSINGLRGNKTLIDYAATTGAVLALTYSLAQSTAGLRHPGELRGARAGLDATDPVDLRRGPGQLVRQPGAQGRAAHPDEIVPSYVFFASGRLSSYDSGEVRAPIGGETLPG